MSLPAPSTSTPIRDEFAKLTSPIVALLTVSLVSNLLMLTGPLFMLQVYDRVLASRSLPTLVVLTILVAFLYAFYAVLEAIRSRMTLRIGNVIDNRIGGRLFRTAVRLKLAPGAPSHADPIRDGDALRQFVSGAGILSFLDLPWVPIYVAVVFLLHPLLGWLAVAGVVIISALLGLNEFLARRPSEQLHLSTMQKNSRADDAKINAESVLAMGMLARMQARWSESSSAVQGSQNRATDRSSVVSSASKALRFFLQSAVLAVGAYLVIQGEMSGGVMIAASVITSRALAPVEQVVGHWRGFVSARQAADRIRKAFSLPELPTRDTLLPLPNQTVSLVGVATAPPNATRLVVAGISMELRAGDAVGVIGPSGAGKTSLARLLIGVWPTLGGSYRLDGSAMEHYDPSQLGDIVGYLPQRVELFDGTVAENIARFAENPRSEDIIAAARIANVHDLISSFPDGYDTPIGEQGSLLSAGQRQRIGLARAVYGDPFLVVLDEPNSNLDADGDTALTATIETLRSRGAVTVVVAHRPSAIQAVSHVLVLNAGRQVKFGLKDEVLESGQTVALGAPIERAVS